MNGTCTNCGGPSRSHARFCKKPECRKAYGRTRTRKLGWSLAPEQRKRRVHGTCVNCGGPMANRRDSRYCMAKACRAAARRKYAAEYQARTGRRPASDEALERVRQKSTLKRRLRGIKPIGRGQESASWRGGRIAYCAICGVDCGWRVPRDLKRSKQHFCAKHNGSRPNGRHVNCAVCGAPAGYRSKCELKRNTRFLCAAHKRGRRKSPA
jgi:hypothetical protein